MGHLRGLNGLKSKIGRKQTADLLPPLFETPCTPVHELNMTNIEAEI